MHLGRIVHYRVGGVDTQPTLRPAIVVQEWPDEVLNLQVFVDGSNDARARTEDDRNTFDKGELERGSAWRTSVHKGRGIGEWRDPGL